MKYLQHIKKYFSPVSSSKRVLFIQFALKINTHDEPDTQNFFRGKTNMRELFTQLFKEKDPNVEVNFVNYSDFYRKSNGHWFYNGIDLKDFDFAFFGFVGGYGTFPQLIQNYFNKYNVPFLRYGSFSLYNTKSWGMELVESMGYPYIPSLMCQKLSPDILQEINSFGYPVIVKYPLMDRGEGVKKVDNEEQLRKEFIGNREHLMIQKMIPNDGDYRIITLKNKVQLVCHRKVQSSTEFRSNVALGGKAIRATLPEEILKACEEVSKKVNCDIIGFDILKDLKTGKWYFMEINETPHFTTFSLVTGVNLPQIIVDYIYDNL